MTASSQELPRPFYRLEEYFALERESDARYEYWDGQILCMSGSSPQHASIGFNTGLNLGNHSRGSRCRVFNGDLAIKTPALPPYRSPDLSAVSGPPIYEKIEGIDTLVNPTIIIEVLSPRSAALGRKQKRKAYQALPSLQEYLLVEQRVPRVTHYLRQGGKWEKRDYVGLTTSFTVPSLNVTLTLGALYEDVEFPA